MLWSCYLFVFTEAGRAYTYLPTYYVPAYATVCLLVPAFCISFYLFSMKKSFEVSQELSQQSLSWFTWLKVQISMQYKITLLLVLEALWLLFIAYILGTKVICIWEHKLKHEFNSLGGLFVIICSFKGKV